MARPIYEIEKELTAVSHKRRTAKQQGNRTLTCELQEEEMRLTMELRSAKLKNNYTNREYLDWDYFNC